MITDVVPDVNSPIDNNAINLSQIPASDTANTTSFNTIVPVTTHTKYNIDQYLKQFDTNFIGTPVIIIEFTDSNASTWHPLKWAKLLTSNFFGISNIKPTGHKKVRITFDSIYHANICLESTFFVEHKLSAYIPSTLIFSHGIIKLDTSKPEEDFWESILCDVPTIGFKRIAVNRQ
jgi:hypothetical protein